MGRRVRRHRKDLVAAAAAYGVSNLRVFGSVARSDDHSDSNGARDTGHLHVTYYDNFFQNFSSRTPSLRFGTGHVFNNYFVNGSTGL